MLLNRYSVWLSVVLCFAAYIVSAQNVKADSLRLAIHKAPSSQKADLYRALVDELIATNLPQARATALEMLDVAARKNDTTNQLSAIKLLFNISTLAGDYDEANALLTQLQSYIANTHQPQHAVVLKEGPARIALERGEYKKSIDLYQQAIRHNEQYKAQYPQLNDNLRRDYVNYAIALMSWAYMRKTEGALTTTEEQETYRQCNDYFHKALAYRIDEKNTVEIINVYSNLMSLNHALGEQRDSAYYYADKAIELARAENKTDYRAYTNSALAQLYMDDGNYKKAQQQVDRALELYMQINNQKYIGTTLLLKAGIHKHELRYDDAIEVTKKALPLLQASENNTGLADAYFLLSELYEQIGNHQEALSAYRAYNLYKGKVIDEQQAKEIAWIKGKFESENKAKQITELQRDKVISENAAQQNEDLLIIAALIILIMLAILIIFRMRMRAQKIKSRISEQELLTKLKEEELRSISKILESRETERKRIAGDLHDRLGVMLATSSMLIEKSISDGHPSPLLDNSLSLNRDAADEVRRVSQELSSPVLQRFGLGPAINEMANSINSTGKFQVDLSGMDIQFNNADVEVNLYRILQELINNTIRHSGGNIIRIGFEQNSAYVVIRYEDNGKGIDTTGDWKGVGWKSIESRIQHLDAKIEMISTNSKTYIQIDIPMYT